MPVAERITDDWEYRLHKNEDRRGNEAFGLWIHGPDEEYPLFSETGNLCVRYHYNPGTGSRGEPLSDEFLSGFATFYDHIEAGGEYSEVETILLNFSLIEKWAAVHGVMNLIEDQTLSTLKPLLERAFVARSDASE